jgi:predicted ArsR family transcriptional regulator
VNDEPEPRRRREQVLDLLRSAAEPLETAEIAESLGIHANTVRFHLAALVRSGRVESVAGRRTGPGRPPTAYRVVERMDPDGHREYRALAAVLADELASRPRSSQQAVEIGRRWGRQVAAEEPTVSRRSPRAAHARMRRLLDRLGFAPDAADDGRRIGLRSCPFLELAEHSSRVVCPIHLGLMQGALETWRAPLAVERLDAFVEPDLCLVHVTPLRAASGAAS